MTVLATILAALYALTMAVLLVYGLHLLALALHHTAQERLVEGLVPDADALPEAPPTWPRVTVQLPLYNETAVAERLLDACAQLRYPANRLDIQVLDDSTDETTAIVAQRVERMQRRGLRAVHVRRPTRTGFKAGALQHGLHLATGDLVAIFDADFVPPPDFLLRTVPHFDAPDVGVVQARWGHLNADASLLTRLQAIGLDAHFVLEQQERSRAGLFLHFNGTAGLWRRACIDDAGGWQADTLTEDMDLSYRAQLRGWRIRYLPHVEVPAELPGTLPALRQQQLRWAKGAGEVALKLLRPLWRSRQPLRVRLAGTLHLTAHLVFPALLVATLLHAPLLVLSDLGFGPSPAYFAVMALGLVGFGGFVLAHVLTQRWLHPDWPRRLLALPAFAAGSMGMAVTGTQALWEALRGRRSPFERTPKAGRRQHLPAAYVMHHHAGTVWAEAALALYSLAAVGVLVARGLWSAVPFQLLMACGFGLVAVAALRRQRPFAAEASTP